jgi:hypothetical protein
MSVFRICSNSLDWNLNISFKIPCFVAVTLEPHKCVYNDKGKLVLKNESIKKLKCLSCESKMKQRSLCIDWYGSIINRGELMQVT